MHANGGSNSFGFLGGPGRPSVDLVPDDDQRESTDREVVARQRGLRASEGEDGTDELAGEAAACDCLRVCTVLENEFGELK